MSSYSRWSGQSSLPESPGAIDVPPGHELKAYTVPQYMDPSLHWLDGGAYVMCLGHGSDEPGEELDELLGQFQLRLEEPQRPVLLSGEEEPLSQLFAPAIPSAQPVAGCLIWVFPTRGLDDWLGDPARLQKLLRSLSWRGPHHQPLARYAYFEADSGPRGAVLARLLAGLGLSVRVATPAPERLILVEVHRPDGTVHTTLAGHALPRDGGVDTVAADKDSLNQALQRFQSELHQIPLARAPRLCRLLRATVDKGGPGARQEVERELLARPWPLLLLMKPDGRSTFTAEFPGIGPALRAYPDLVSLQQTAKELELAPGSYLVGALTVRSIFGWGAQQNLAIALNVYMTPHTPTYVMWLPAEAGLIAEGQYATLTPEELHGLLEKIDGDAAQGRHESAFRHLRRIFSYHPENLDAHERAYRLYVAAGNTAQAFEQLLNVLRLCTRRREVQRAEPYLQAILEQQPDHPEVPIFLSELRPGQD